MKAKDLRNSILQMAVQGKLVPQDPTDEPASVLLERIRAERAKLIKEKKIKAPKGGESVIYRASDGSHYEKRGKGEPVCIDDEIPFEIPESWEWVRYAAISDTLAGYAFKSSDFKPSGKYRLLRGINLGVNEVRWNDVVYIDEMPANAKAYKLEQGDVLLGLDRPWITSGLRTAILDDEKDTYLVQRVLRIRGTIAASEEWLRLLLDTPLLSSAVAKDMTGISVPHISEKQVTSILVPLPPFLEQHRITARITQLFSLIDQYGALEDARERLDAELPDRLRKSILQIAVQGKLVEQDPTDEPASALLERIRTERAKLVKAGKHKVPKGGESVIYRASDGGYYEKRGKGESQPIEVPFDIPESWMWAHVKDFGYFTSGKTPSKHDQSFYGGDHLWVTSKDMKSFRIEKTGITLSDKGAAELNTYSPGTMLFVVRSGILKRFLPIAILDNPATVNQDIKAFTLYVPQIAVGLAYFIKAFEPFILNELTKSVTTVDSLRFDEFQNMLIPVPPEAEWERIIAQLNSALGSVITNQ